MNYQKQEVRVAEEEELNKVKAEQEKLQTEIKQRKRSFSYGAQPSPLSRKAISGSDRLAVFPILDRNPPTI